MTRNDKTSLRNGRVTRSIDAEEERVKISVDFFLF